MKCSNCGYENSTGSNFCGQCNNRLNQASPEGSPETAPASVESSSSPETEPSSPVEQEASSYTSSQVYSNAYARNYPQYSYQQPYYYQPYFSKPKQPFTITDAFIIIGFVLAIVGVFTYAFLLLPASIAFSVVGFRKRTNIRTLGLSIAGIVVGVVACLIRIGSALNELGIIPDWLSSGIF